MSESIRITHIPDEGKIRSLKNSLHIETDRLHKAIGEWLNSKTILNQIEIKKRLLTQRWQAEEQPFIKKILEIELEKHVRVRDSRQYDLAQLDFLRTLKHHTSRISELKKAISFYDKPTVELTSYTLDEIKDALPPCVTNIYTQDGILYVETDDSIRAELTGHNSRINIICGEERIPLPPARIAFPLERKFSYERDFHAFVLTDGTGWNNGYGYDTPHPHILSGGEPCLGDFGPCLREVAEQGDIPMMILIALEFFRVIDQGDSAGQMWPERFIKQDRDWKLEPDRYTCEVDLQEYVTRITDDGSYEDDENEE